MTVLNLEKSIKILQAAGIKFVKGRKVRNEKELEKTSIIIGFPMAMKIVSRKISHKTDVGGVQLNIKNLAEAKKAFAKLKKLKGFEGVYLQKMHKGNEVIIGANRDATFGPVVMFGLGGVFVEVLKDVAIKVCPLEKKDAEEMIKEIKGYNFLKGIRGEKAVNFKQIENYLLAISKLMVKNSKLKEIDINPLFADEKEVVAVDARVVI